MLDPDDYRVVLRRNQKPGSTMGQTDFHRAAFLGDLDRIEDLRRGGWEQLDVKNDAGLTPMMQAAVNGHVDVVSYLIDHGANPLSVDNDGWTAMHYAALKDQKEVIKILAKVEKNLEKERKKREKKREKEKLKAKKGGKKGRKKKGGGDNSDSEEERRKAEEEEMNGELKDDLAPPPPAWKVAAEAGYEDTSLMLRPKIPDPFVHEEWELLPQPYIVPVDCAELQIMIRDAPKIRKEASDDDEEDEEEDADGPKGSVIGSMNRGDRCTVLERKWDDVRFPEKNWVRVRFETELPDEKDPKKMVLCIIEGWVLPELNGVAQLSWDIPQEDQEHPIINYLEAKMEEWTKEDAKKATFAFLIRDERGKKKNAGSDDAEIGDDKVNDEREDLKDDSEGGRMGKVEEIDDFTRNGGDVGVGDDE